MKRKRINRILCRQYDLHFDHTLDLELGIFRSEFEIALSQEWDGRLTRYENDVGHLFMTIVLANVTKVGWLDVADSDRDDFARWRAADISSLF